MTVMIVFGQIPKAAESVGKVKDGAKLMVRVDIQGNILKESKEKYRSVQKLHHNVKSIANLAYN